MFEENNKYAEELLYCKDIKETETEKIYTFKDGKVLHLDKDTKICSEVTNGFVKTQKDGFFGAVVFYDERQIKEFESTEKNLRIDCKNNIDKINRDYEKSQEKLAIERKISEVNDAIQNVKELESSIQDSDSAEKIGEVLDEFARINNYIVNTYTSHRKYYGLDNNERLYDKHQPFPQSFSFKQNNKEYEIVLQYTPYVGKLEGYQIKIDGNLLYDNGMFIQNVELGKNLSDFLRDFYHKKVEELNEQLTDLKNVYDKKIEDLKKEQEQKIDELNNRKEQGYIIIEPKYNATFLGNDSIRFEDNESIYFYDRRY